MPVSPKSPQRKPGAPKAKGAVRAKSGCYTCRIRRKKCDEQPNGDGQCQTCVRLRLQCLGFGAKRPDWLRENRSVIDLREKIKAFLAAQGMIKGHSGTSARGSEQEQAILTLSPFEPPYPSSSTSPRTPTLSASPDDRAHHPPTYHGMRDVPYSQEPRLPSMDTMRGESPGYAAQDVVLPSYSTQHIISPNSSLDPWSSSSISCRTVTPTDYHTPTDFPSRALASALSPSYSYRLEDEDICDGDVVAPIGTMVPVSDNWGLSAKQHDTLKHYMDHVLRIQYLHADQSLNETIWKLLTSCSAARDAACLLSNLHRTTMRMRTSETETEDRRAYNRMLNLVTAHRPLQPGEALACLCIVSYFLFCGGRGKWEAFLNAVCDFSRLVLSSNKYHGPAHVLQKCDKELRFIIKTSMWFDVLASVTLVRTPQLMDIYRSVFSIYPTDHYNGNPTAPPEELSMMSVMGCENYIVRALAETADLAWWKEYRRADGSLSIPQLASRGQQIEEILEGPHQTRAGAGASCDNTERSLVRRYTSEVFRTSAQVYLNSVISGDYPQCPEIQTGITATIAALKAVPEGSHTSRAVVRSVVFSICICGCLTDDPNHREFFEERLRQQSSTVGNCNQVLQLMRRVWSKRARGDSVDWRQVMRESEMLLV